MKIVSVNSQSAILKELGLRIKRNRLDMQLSQQDFAQKAGQTTEQAVSNIQTSENTKKGFSHRLFGK